MLESAWLFTGALAVLATVGAVLAPDDGLAIVGGTAGFLAWGVWTFGTLEIVAVGDSSTFTFTHPSLTMLGIAMALVPAYIALTGPVSIISRAGNDTRPEDL